MCVCVCVWEGGAQGYAKDKSTKGVSFYLPCSRWSLCIIHWLQAFWIGPTLLYISANHTCEIHNKYTMPTKYIELDFQVSFDSTCIFLEDISICFKQIQTTRLCSHVYAHCCFISKNSTTM